MRRTITIAGGGLAGLTLGLLLRRDNIPVEIWDAGSYPRHRVCGEFISGGGLEILRELGLPEIPVSGVEARSVRLFHSRWSSPCFSLPEPALSIDRATLDHALAGAFRAGGGILHENRRWTNSFEREGVVRATGRRLVGEGREQFLGFKVHARELPLTADLELHFCAHSYVGLSAQKDGTVNICGLFRRTKTLRREEVKSLFEQVLSGEARERMRNASFEEASFRAVAGISLKRERTRGTKECRIGDSICMIPPLTGNGMSLALESASLAAPFLRQYSRGMISWAHTRTEISQICDRRFCRRLFSAALLQNLAFSAIGRRAMMYFLETRPQFFTLWFRLTR